MIGYRFLSVAEQEVSESMEFYEAREAGLSLRFQDELSRIIRLLRMMRRSARYLTTTSVHSRLINFFSQSFMELRRILS